jgi:hypothetical protein
MYSSHVLKPWMGYFLGNQSQPTLTTTWSHYVVPLFAQLSPQQTHPAIVLCTTVLSKPYLSRIFSDLSAGVKYTNEHWSC